MAITSGSLPLKKQAAYLDYLVNIHRASTTSSGQISARANSFASRAVSTGVNGTRSGTAPSLTSPMTKGRYTISKAVFLCAKVIRKFPP
jgi:hypothetical protein